MKGLNLLLPLPLLLSGCGSLNSQHGPEWPWPEDQPACAAGCTSQDAVLSFQKASQFCRSVQNYYERGGRIADNEKLGIGLLGTLSGAVFAPLSRGSAATAWAGLAGSTNALQAAMDESFATSMAVTRRSYVVEAYGQGVTAYQEAGSDDQRVTLAIAMATSCAIAPALADRDTLKAISSTQPAAP